MIAKKNPKLKVTCTGKLEQNLRAFLNKMTSGYADANDLVTEFMKTETQLEKRKAWQKSRQLTTSIFRTVDKGETGRKVSSGTPKQQTEENNTKYATKLGRSNSAPDKAKRNRLMRSLSFRTERAVQREAEEEQKVYTSMRINFGMKPDKTYNVQLKPLFDIKEAIKRNLRHELRLTLKKSKDQRSNTFALEIELSELKYCESSHKTKYGFTWHGRSEVVDIDEVSLSACGNFIQENGKKIGFLKFDITLTSVIGRPLEGTDSIGHFKMLDTRLLNAKVFEWKVCPKRNRYRTTND